MTFSFAKHEDVVDNSYVTGPKRRDIDDQSSDVLMVSLLTCH